MAEATGVAQIAPIHIEEGNAKSKPAAYAPESQTILQKAQDALVKHVNPAFQEYNKPLLLALIVFVLAYGAALGLFGFFITNCSQSVVTMDQYQLIQRWGDFGGKCMEWTGTVRQDTYQTCRLVPQYKETMPWSYCDSKMDEEINNNNCHYPTTLDCAPGQTLETDLSGMSCLGDPDCSTLKDKDGKTAMCISSMAKPDDGKFYCWLGCNPAKGDDDCKGMKDLKGNLVPYCDTQKGKCKACKQTAVDNPLVVAVYKKCPDVGTALGAALGYAGTFAAVAGVIVLFVLTKLKVVEKKQE